MPCVRGPQYLLPVFLPVFKMALVSFLAAKPSQTTPALDLGLDGKVLDAGRCVFDCIHRAVVVRAICAIATPGTT